MKTLILLPMATVAGALFLSSCSTVKTAATKVGDGGREMTSDFEGPRIAGLFKRRPYIAEVREKDLKDMPLGEERAPQELPPGIHALLLHLGWRPHLPRRHRGDLGLASFDRRACLSLYG